MPTIGDRLMSTSNPTFKTRRHRSPRAPKFALLVLIPVSGALWLASDRIHGPTQSAADSLYSPLAGMGAVVSRSVSRTMAAARNAIDSERRVRELEAEVSQLRAEVAFQQNRCHQLAGELLGLQQLWDRRRTESPAAEFLMVSRPLEIVGIPAASVASDSSSFRFSILADRGEAHGVLPDSPVAIGGALAGKVQTTAAETSRILLIFDPSFRASVQILKARKETRVNRTENPSATPIHGLLRGVRPGLCSVKYIPRDTLVSPGDRVVSSGLDGQFPSGLLVGEVKRVVRRDLFLDIEVRPEAEADSLNALLILRPVREPGRPVTRCQ